MKRKLFIGSSKEGLPIAKPLKNKIDAECGSWIETEIWKEGKIFSLNKNALESLVRASRKFDYGVMVATKDDILKSRRSKKRVPRDNVMFEMGMFLGSLGLTRAFLLVEEKNKLPTDYNGVTVPYFERKKAGSLDKAIKKITTSIHDTSSTYNLKPVPSAALALGYFDNFVHPLAKKKHGENSSYKLEIFLPKMINDIDTTKTDYLNKNPSTEISLYPDAKRPVVYELNATQGHFWDVPTTLSTLNKLMDILHPSSEIGTSREKQDWIEHELRNFKGTLEMLVQQSVACSGKITVTYLP